MNNADYAKLTRKQLLAQMEQERQEWLDAGMSEADIFRIHFGEVDGDGKLRRPKDEPYTSDYFTWLDERKHSRPDHKYSPGAPVAIDTIDPDGAWISGGRSGLDEAEFNIDLEAGLSMLSDAQSGLVRAVVYKGATLAEYARDKHINKSVASRTLNRAKKNLKKFFGEGNESSFPRL